MTTVAPPPLSNDGGRARHPDRSDVATSSDGVRIAFEVFGSGDPTLVLLPSAPIIHSRQWKGQVPFLSRHWRVVTYDGRGNGRSDRPVDPESYLDERFVDDLEAVLDATGTDRAVLIGLCVDGVWRSIRFAASNRDRVLGIVGFAVGVPRLAPPQPHYVSAGQQFDDELPTSDGWQKMNRHHWRRDYADFARFFFEEMASEPHSSKAVEDAAGWATDGSIDAMLANHDAPFDMTLDEIEATCRSVRCPMLLVHGSEDTCQSPARAHRLAELTGAPLVMVEGADHMIPGRHPVLANLIIRDFVTSLPTEGTER
ncbi:MAG TPA: alpha/beta hydrolase [Candidatus Limnocylindrales bacterium]|nr:alpha/beta hydrolase [Candidatus Limnocylindrales bacterium]